MGKGGAVREQVHARLIACITETGVESKRDKRHETTIKKQHDLGYYVLLSSTGSKKKREEKKQSSNE